MLYAITLIVIQIGALMATKDTPKKYYKDLSVATNISLCRLCNCVTDPGHSKKLFRDSHKAILKNAEQIYGGVLPQQEGLPHLICRSCERKLHNATQLRNTIIETQQLLRKDIRTKRCIEVSPSVAKPSAKVHAAGPCRRSLDFSVPAIAEKSHVSHSRILIHYPI
jgi:hypothetical protein